MSQQKIFNKIQYKLHRDRASLNDPHYLYKYVTDDIAERLSMCSLPNKIKFLEFGGRGHDFNRAFKTNTNVEKITADISSGLLNKRFYSTDLRVQCDEESLPFCSNSFDVVVSNLHMHWTNDISYALSNFYRTLKNRGVFIMSIIGGESLKGLRNSFVEVESRLNNVKYHISPMVRPDSLSLLVQKSAFKDSIIDSYNLRLEYKDFHTMLNSFRSMGESNCLQDKVHYLKRGTLEKVADNYSTKHTLENGSIYCDVEILSAIGYK